MRVLRDAGHRVVATELVDYGRAETGIITGMDFLAQTRAPKGVSCIVTNPPYQIASKFVRHALELVPDVLVLMRLAFLEGQRRSDILDHHLQRVHVFKDRLPMMHRDGWAGPRSTSAIAFCWMRFARERMGPPTINRISWRERRGIRKQRITDGQTDLEDFIKELAPAKRPAVRSESTSPSG